MPSTWTSFLGLIVLTLSLLQHYCTKYILTLMDMKVLMMLLAAYQYHCVQVASMHIGTYSAQKGFLCMIELGTYMIGVLGLPSISYS